MISRIFDCTPAGRWLNRKILWPMGRCGFWEWFKP